MNFKIVNDRIRSRIFGHVTISQLLKLLYGIAVKTNAVKSLGLIKLVFKKN
jgi:hypothetical protein